MASITARCSSVILPLSLRLLAYGKSSMTGSGSVTAGALVFAGIEEGIAEGVAEGVAEDMEGMNGVGRAVWAAG